jgi:hypothetical protein
MSNPYSKHLSCNRCGTHTTRQFRAPGDPCDHSNCLGTLCERTVKAPESYHAKIKQLQRALRDCAERLDYNRPESFDNASHEHKFNKALAMFLALADEEIK